MYELAAKYNRCAAGILLILRSVGVAGRKLTDAHKRLKIDETYFSQIDTHDKARFLGFIWADGCITGKPGKECLSISLSAKDTEYLEHLREQIKAEVTVKVEKGGTMIMFKTFNRAVVAQLKRLGLFQRKSLHIGFPTADQVPAQFWSSFILGVFEGDGSIKQNKAATSYGWSLCGTTEFCKMVQQIFRDAVGINSTLSFADTTQDIPLCTLHVSGHLQIVKVMEWMYEHCAFKMRRKYERYLRLRSFYDANMCRIMSPEAAERNRQTLSTALKRSWNRLSLEEQEARLEKRAIARIRFAPVFHLKSPTGAVYESNCILRLCQELQLHDSHIGDVVRQRRNVRS